MAEVLTAPQRQRADSGLRTLTAISISHWISHFHMLVLPMLFPFLKEQLGVGYIELGFALTVFALVSGLTQAPMGYLVDHVGARTILLIGITLGGLSLVMLGLHLSYAWLIGCAVLLGLANSVYHPADYAILSAHMDEARMGRAFAVHTFAGFLGGAVAPAIVATLVTAIGGLGALMVAGAAGPAVALLLIMMGTPDAGAKRKGKSEGAPKQNIITPALIVLTTFFMLLSLSSAGISNFGVVALMSGYAASFSSANLALTAFLAASAVGVLAGGFIADHIERHAQLAAGCFAVNALVVLLIATMTLPSAILVVAMAAAGFLGGVIAPSRDMMVRNAAPSGAAGRAFGIVSTGFNIGGIVSPLLFGWIMDQSAPRWVFGASVVFMVLTVLLTFLTDRRSNAAQS
ncbi:MAG: MFS transporter [Bradyrhizobium sp.]|uniref:MFS transporter n=1 Tax=Bradyrhizobium sp. TaxID=376 RepID=UPI0025C6BA6F|nr:MFS transporter [Bradyrhizobium sp.]MBI5262961.1 MFS transporter [Bradyrhizobium sp.]